MRWSVASVLIAGLLLARAAHAEDKEAVAEGLFADGVSALDAGRTDEACALFEKAVGILDKKPVGGLLALAECREKQRRPASAWALYKEAYALAQRDGDPRHAKAASEIARLEPTLPRVAVRVAPTLAARSDLEIRRDGVALPREAWGRPLPVDPGNVVISAHVPGVAPLIRQLVIPAQAATHEAAIEPWGCLVSATCASPSGPPLTPDPGIGDRRSAEAEPAVRPLGVAGIVIGSVGIAAAATALGLAIDAKQLHDATLNDDALCSADGCNSKGNAIVDDARFRGDVATALTVSGLVLLGTGVTLLTIDLATREPVPRSVTRRFTLHPDRVALELDW